jgi:hypothetical protein
MRAEPFRNRYFAAARLQRFSGPRPSWADRSSRRVSRAVAGPPTDRGSDAVIQGAATYRRIRWRDHGHAVGDESASRNRKFESTSLQRRVRSEPTQKLDKLLTTFGSTNSARVVHRTSRSLSGPIRAGFHRDRLVTPIHYSIDWPMRPTARLMPHRKSSRCPIDHSPSQ